MFCTRRAVPSTATRTLSSSTLLLTRGFAQLSGCKMTLHRLAIRTKKSLSGLYSPNKEKECGLTSPSYVCSHSIQCRLNNNRSNIPRETASNPTVTPTKTNCSPRDEFGLLRSDDDISPSGKGSPSRRHRILGSLRSMRSLRTLRVTHNSFKKSEEEPTVSRFPQTPVSGNKRNVYKKLYSKISSDVSQCLD